MVGGLDWVEFATMFTNSLDEFQLNVTEDCKDRLKAAPLIGPTEPET